MFVCSGMPRVAGGSTVATNEQPPTKRKAAKRKANATSAVEAERIADEKAAVEAKGIADEQAAIEAERIADEKAAVDAKRAADAATEVESQLMLFLATIYSSLEEFILKKAISTVEKAKKNNKSRLPCPTIQFSGCC